MNDTTTLAQRVDESLRIIPDFPIPGVQFRDITPLLGDVSLMREVIDAMSAPFASRRITHVVGIESRGFIFAMPMALVLGASFVPARKLGKLPHRTIRQDFELEYRADSLEMHADALGPGAKALIVDDVLATGGSARAAVALVEQLGGSVSGIAVLTEIAALNGRGLLEPHVVHSLLRV